MTDDTNNNIHRTPALDKMGLARCRKDNKLFSWRKGGSCKVCGARVEAAPEAPPATAPKRARKPASPAAPPAQPAAPKKRARQSGGRSGASKK